MALTHRVTTSVRSNAGTVSSVTGTFTGTGEVNIEETIALGTDTLVVLAVDVSEIVSMAIVSSTAMTIETNSATVPDDTITLVANKPLIWNTDILATLGTACPLTTDVTAFYCTNAAEAELSVYILMDATP